MFLGYFSQNCNISWCCRISYKISFGIKSLQHFCDIIQTFLGVFWTVAFFFAPNFFLSLYLLKTHFATWWFFHICDAEINLKSKYSITSPEIPLFKFAEFNSPHIYKKFWKYYRKLQMFWLQINIYIYIDISGSNLVHRVSNSTWLLYNQILLLLILGICDNRFWWFFSRDCGKKIPQNLGRHSCETFSTNQKFDVVSKMLPEAHCKNTSSRNTFIKQVQPVAFITTYSKIESFQISALITFYIQGVKRFKKLIFKKN